MKREIYEMPQVNVVEMDVESVLLAASITATAPDMERGDGETGDPNGDIIEDD